MPLVKVFNARHEIQVWSIRQQTLSASVYATRRPGARDADTYRIDAYTLVCTYRLV